MSENAFRRRIAPSVPLEIEFTDERGTYKHTYKVAFTFNTMATIAEKTGLQALTFDIWNRMDAFVMRAMLWASLQVYHPEFLKPGSLEDVGGMLDGENQERAILALWDAYLLYLPKDQADHLRQRREAAERQIEEAQKKAEEAGLPMTPAPETKTTPAEPSPSPTGSDSGPFADTISESPIAKSAA